MGQIRGTGGVMKSRYGGYSFSFIISVILLEDHFFLTVSESLS
jgi:hypothetical protein